MFRLATPRAVFAAAVVLLLVVAGLVGMVAMQRADGCRDAVAARDDQRVMWLYALETNPNPEDARALAFRAELDRRIPELTCRGWLGGHPEPKGD